MHHAVHGPLVGPDAYQGGVGHLLARDGADQLGQHRILGREPRTVAIEGQHDAHGRVGRLAHGQVRARDQVGDLPGKADEPERVGFHPDLAAYDAGRSIGACRQGMASVDGDGKELDFGLAG